MSSKHPRHSDQRVPTSTRESTDQGHVAEVEASLCANEARLRESEARLRFSLDAGRLGAWELDADTGRVWRSPWYDRIFGYEEPLAEWTYTMFLEHVVPEQRPRVDAVVERTLATGEPAEFECRIVRADGAERWIWVRGAALEALDTPPRRLFGIVEDITERRGADRARSERSRELALSAAIGAAVTEAGALRPMLQRCAAAVVEHLEAAFARIWTLNERDQVLELEASAGMYTHLNGPHGRIPIGAYRIGCIAEEKEPHLSNTVIGDPRIHDQAWARREGMVAFAGYPLVVEGRLVGVLAMFARHELDDATFRALGAVADGIALAIQRARVEAALRRSEQELKDFLESAVEGIHFVGPDGTILWANKAELDLLGYSHDEYIGHNIAEFHADQDVISDMLVRLARKETLQEYEARLLCKDGSIRHVLVDSNVLWRHGQFVTTRCFTRDITALKCAAAERESVLERERAARTEAEQANRAKSEFLAAMSHELRTPLNAIAGYVQLVELGIHGPVTDAQREALGRVRRSQQHLLALINDILNFAKLEAGRIEYEVADVSLADVVADVSSMVGPQLADKGLSYTVDIAPDINVRVDREKLQQILLNLLSNAAKFTPAGGRVAVDTGSRFDAPEGVAYLRVTDTGCGIPREKQDVIFDPFVQVPARLIRTQEGTGLGLAISRDLARGMGGDLRVRSIEGEGSTFTLTLRNAGAPRQRHRGAQASMRDLTTPSAEGTMMRDPREQASQEPSQEAIDPHRREERDAVSSEIADRLQERGVALTGRESSEEMVDLLDAVERFERAVERHGGDLMVDEGPRGTTREPDDVHFVLPRRGPDESVSSYRERVEAQTRALRRHPLKPSAEDDREMYP